MVNNEQTMTDKLTNNQVFCVLQKANMVGGYLVSALLQDIRIGDPSNQKPEQLILMV